MLKLRHIQMLKTIRSIQLFLQHQHSHQLQLSQFCSPDAPALPARASSRPHRAAVPRR
jgi:hypothetical protein